MMAAIILINADDPTRIDVMRDNAGNNMTFATWSAADDWLEANAENGWCTAIHDLDD